MIGHSVCELNKPEEQPKVELPEEYKAITKSDTLIGYFDKDSVLCIRFNNKRNK